MFSRTGFFARQIQFKTWSRYSHCEVYIESGRTVASRDGQGVNEYDIDAHGLATVLRPIAPVDK